MRNDKELNERWYKIYESYRDRSSKIKGFYLDNNKNIDFFYTVTWKSHLAQLGTFEYLLNQDIVLFKKYLKESILVEQELYEHFEKGDPIHPHCVTLTDFWRMFHPLAIGDFELAIDFAKHNGGRPEIEKEYDTPFQIAFGYTLKSFIEDSNTKVKQEYLHKLDLECKSKSYLPFRGYVIVFEAILEKNNDKAIYGFQEIVKGHEEECKGKGERYFKDSEEEDFCIWGLGMANLAIHYGLNIKIEHPLIPKELLIKA